MALDKNLEGCFTVSPCAADRYWAGYAPGAMLMNNWPIFPIPQ